MIDFLCQIEFLLHKMLKLLEIPGFYQNFSNSKYFSAFIVKFPFFPGFQVKRQPCARLKTNGQHLYKKK